MHRFLSRSDESADLTRRATEFGDSPRILGEFLGQSPNFVALWAIALALCCFTPASLAQDPEKKVTAVHIQSPILIDGNLDEPEWSLAQPATDFVQQEPLMGEPSTERTEVRMLYDDENLYLGVYCFDSAGSEGITITDISRDYAPRETDTFTMVFDTFNDKRNSFIFGTNAGGAKRDGQTAGDSERRNYDWDTVWHVKTKITEQGWQAEIAIPFRSLRFREVEEQVRGVNFGRRIRRKNEYTHWSPIPRPHRTSRVSLAGELNGLSGIRQGRNLYLKPYLLTPVVRREGDDVDFLFDVGFDLKYGVTSELALDVTLNTDFSQVEADLQQINLTRFPLFFPEKREFFLENAPLFQVRRVGRGLRNSSRDLIAFFSRRIGLSQGRVVPILGGARVTGRVGPYGIGFLSIQTDEFEELPSTNFTVARVQRDILGNSDVGGIFINKQGGGQYNRTYGVDGRLQFFQNLEIASFFLKTDTPGLSGEDTSASAFVGWADHRYDIQAEYLSIEDNFNPEVGFIPRKGIRKSRGEFNLKLRPGRESPGCGSSDPLLESSTSPIRPTSYKPKTSTRRSRWIGKMAACSSSPTGLSLNDWMSPFSYSLIRRSLSGAMCLGRSTPVFPATEAACSAATSA